ncbi:MAG: GerAB/ArcD/ProY family transporter [Clostridia bacterium]|nr:GerAB/ArcD/ProY family transporter [Clostridia bacterium]
MTLTDNRRFISLIASVAVGDFVLRISFSNSITSDLVGILSACLLSVLAAVLLKSALDFYKKKSFKYKPLCSGIIMLSSAVPLVWTSLSSASNLSRYAENVMLKSGSSILYFISILVLAVFVAFQHRNVTLKLGLVLFPIIAIFVLLMFALSVQFMNLKYIVPYSALSVGSVWKTFSESAVCLFSAFIPSLILGNTAKKRHFAIAFAIASSIIIVCFLNTALIFGAELSSTLEYPYSQAVSTASFGHIFSRMDGFLYAVCFFTSFLKTGVCLLCAIELVKRALGSIFFQKNQLSY